MSDLCREFGISRKTGYKIHARYQQNSVVGLYDESRAPDHIPHRTSPELTARVLELRKKHPTWGPRKLRSVLREKDGSLRWPAASTIGDMLRKEGLTQPRRRRRSVEPYEQKLSMPTRANELWCIDFKGQFRLGNGRLCYPLTVTDAHTRFLITCEGMDAIDGDQVWVELRRAFEQFGLPQAIRSDNGSPFASRGIHGFSKLSVRWIALGIRHERIEPGKPEQNGRHERMHRTLKAETTRPAAKSMLAQQERFDRFVQIYNEERPHEALEQTPPARHYEPSTRSYASAKPLAYPLHDEVRKVSACGHVTLKPRSTLKPRTKIFVGTALAGMPVGLRELADERWLVSFAETDLAVWDLASRSLLSPEASAQIQGFTNS